MGGHHATCERVLFAEREQVMGMLQQLVATDLDLAGRLQKLCGYSSVNSVATASCFSIDNELGGQRPE